MHTGGDHWFNHLFGGDATPERSVRDALRRSTTSGGGCAPGRAELPAPDCVLRSPRFRDRDSSHWGVSIELPLEAEPEPPSFLSRCTHVPHGPRRLPHLPRLVYRQSVAELSLSNSLSSSAIAARYRVRAAELSKTSISELSGRLKRSSSTSRKSSVRPRNCARKNM